MWKNINFKSKVTVLSFIFILFTAITGAGYHLMTNSIRDIGIQQASETMLNGYKNELKDIIDVVAQSLSSSTKNISSEREIHNIFKMITSDARFFPDKSGYFFIYKKGGTVVLNAASPKMNGKNFYDLKDPNGKLIIRELENAANNGGGFVDYVWKKPGKGELPKLSYAQQIPNSQYWIGTGVYIEDIKEKEEQIFNIISDYSKNFLIKLYTFLAIIFFIILLPITIYMIKSMVIPLSNLTDIAVGYSRGDLDHEFLDIDRKDEIGSLSRAIKRLGRSTKIIMRKLDETQIRNNN